MGIHEEREEVVGLASFGGTRTNFDSIMGEVTDLVAAGGEVTDLVAAGGEVVEASLGDSGVARTQPMPGHSVGTALGLRVASYPGPAQL